MIKKETLASLQIDKLLPSLMSDDEKAELKKIRINKKRAKKGLPAKEKAPPPPVTFSMQDPDSLMMKDFMAGLIDPVTGVIRDLRVDDRGLREAVNYYDFIYNIVGKDAHPPWARQFLASVTTFGEICPKCSNPKWMDIFQVPKDFPTKDLKHPKRLVFLENGVCPHCGLTKRDILKDKLMPWYNQFVYVWGQRSGKSSTAATMAAYTLHKYMKYPMLATLTKSMQRSTQLTGIFCSLSYDKAVEVLWTPFKNIIDNVGWFQEYFALLDDYEQKTGTALYLNQKTNIVIGHKNLHIFPTGPTASKLRGNTSFFCILDELGLFPLPDPTKHKDTENDVNRRADSDEAYASLNNSLLTVNNARLELIKQGYFSAPPSYMGSVSSPVSDRDKVMRLLADSQHNRYLYGCNLATWEINPYLERNSPEIESAFLSDPIKAMRDFGAKPNSSSNAFYSSNIVQTLFTGAPNTHTFQYKSEGTQVWGVVKQVSSVRFPCVMALDAGHVNNSFGVSVAYYDFDDKRIKLACALECMPEKGCEVNFTKLYTECLLPLAKQLNCVYVLADQWNSIDLLQRLMQDGGKNPKGKPRIQAAKYSLKRSDFDAIASMFRNGNVVFPAIPKRELDSIVKKGVADYKKELYNKPIHHLLLQLLTVVDNGPGRCPSKAPGYTDDLFRAVALSIAKINTDKIMNRLEEARAWTVVHNVMPEPIVLGRSNLPYI